jgi:hypothetical protein
MAAARKEIAANSQPWPSEKVKSAKVPEKAPTPYTEKLSK